MHPRRVAGAARAHSGTEDGTATKPCHAPLAVPPSRRPAVPPSGDARTGRRASGEGASPDGKRADEPGGAPSEATGRAQPLRVVAVAVEP
ncbi:hypothetical protein GCM10010269_83450 [Streptomyces humidus]|uniref:Uncharacterized protein n=1 Tax=Streptomyces humidus TaxID=52259 RepID=A0A918LDN0_9ACTN|nr:hypothetical protein GCM10010269_83450 [Streptomyces humidus]